MHGNATVAQGFCGLSQGLGQVSCAHSPLFHTLAEARADACLPLCRCRLVPMVQVSETTKETH